MKMVLIFVILYTIGCARNQNPVQFSKIQTQNASIAKNKSLSQAEAEYAAEEARIWRQYTLLELYLAEKIDRDYMMAWFFKDVNLYRAKLYEIEAEIETKQPLSEHDVDRILLLEAGMNDAIRKFNERTLAKRSTDVVGAVLETADKRNKRTTYYPLQQVEEEGAPASAISDNVLGFLASFIKYGFAIEPVNFLDR